MKIIVIESKTYGAHEVLVDDEDFEELSRYHWHVFKSKKRFYTRRSTGSQKSNNRATFFMHRQLLKLSSDNKLVIDHIDGNGLNNQKSNLRVCTSGENSRNRSINCDQTQNSTSKYKGVSWHKESRKWAAQIRNGNKNSTIGRFNCEKDAARAYNAAAVKYYGEFARLNIIED